MPSPLPPGVRRRPLPLLPKAALIVSACLCVFALVMGAAQSLCAQLAHDPIVMRALGATLAVLGAMLARVAVRAAAGIRRAVAVLLASPVLLVGLLLLVRPSAAVNPYDAGWAPILPWLVAAPGVGALLLSRWRAGS